MVEGVADSEVLFASGFDFVPLLSSLTDSVEISFGSINSVGFEDARNVKTFPSIDLFCTGDSFWIV